METLGNNFVAKNGKITSNKYYCEFCEYKCFKTYNWNKHLLTAKHQHKQYGNNMETKNGKKWQNNCCEICNKEFNTRSGLWKHHKICKIVPTNYDNNNKPTDKELMMMILKDNSELKKMMMEVVKNGTIQNTNNITTNSHNKSFNLNFFLNETCKSAMNITDFVESIKLRLSDLERVGELGYIEGISNIIVKNLKDLDITQRPVHCTDKKRETMYIKDEDKWKKDEKQEKIHSMIRKVTVKNARMLPKFKEVHPDCISSDSRFSDQYNNIIMEAMGGSGDNEFEKGVKIIKKISKEVMVGKDFL